MLRYTMYFLCFLSLVAVIAPAGLGAQLDSSVGLSGIWGLAVFIAG